MGARSLIFAFALLAAGGLIVTGCAMWSQPVAFVVAGVLLAVWAWLVLGERPEREPR